MHLKCISLSIPHQIIDFGRGIPRLSLKMHVFIWEKNKLQSKNLQAIFEGERHNVQQCSGYQDLRLKLRPLLSSAVLLVVNTNVLSSLRQLYHLHRYAPYLSIMALCSQQDSPSHLAILNAGADAYLAQPFTAEILLAQSHALQRHSTRLLQAKLESNTQLESLHGFTFNFEQYEAKQGSKNLGLNKREFLLFHCLIKHPENIHARSKLYALIWPQKTYTQGRQVDNLVVSLKRKLSEQSVEIKSYYGEGYQLTLLS